MEPQDRIYCPPRRPRLGLDPPQYRWRLAGWLLLGCAAISAMIWLELK